MNQLVKFVSGWSRVPIGIVVVMMGLFFGAVTVSAIPPANTNTNWPRLKELLKKWEPVPLPEIQNAAEKGDLTAEHYLGYCFTEGLRVEQNPSAGVAWYQRALNGGYLPSANNLGLLYQRGRLGSPDLAKAIYYYQFAADRGLDQAQVNLGYLYQNGQGVPQDYTEAMRWFQMTAAKGNADAMVEIGRLYRFGQGVSTNLPEALRWFRRAMNENNSALARLNIGLLYQAAGQMADAIPYFQQAAEQGSTDAMMRLYDCYWEGNEIQADHAKAASWLFKAAGAGNAYAECVMGYRAENPDWAGRAGSPKSDWPTALRWYRKSAEQNWAGGQYHLGLLYLQGKAVEMDEARGLELIRAAASQGSEYAQYELAGLYARGVGGPRNKNEQPLALLEQLGKWSELELRYEHGLGTPRDLVMAAGCFCKMLLHENLYSSYSDFNLADKIELKPPRDELIGTPIRESPDEHVQILGPPHRSHDANPDVLRMLSPYLKSALGDGNAAYRIGNLYLTGSDTPRSTTWAWAWFQIAAKNRFNPAREIIINLEKQMTTEEKTSAQEKMAALMIDLQQVAPALH